jgi:Asp-tRNA(Asn)/Glu-tRNA(Gln) amidotransferase A subunit family amidase
VPQGAGYPERIAALASALSREGIATDTVELPFPLEDFRRLQQEICYWEAARLLLGSGAVRPLPELRTLLQPYLEQDLSPYADARRRRQAYQAQFATLVESYDAVLVPAATGVAPALADTGDAVMSRFWTALHLPAITVPVWRSDDGLPLGLQLLGALGTDRHLIATAQWLLERGTPALGEAKPRLMRRLPLGSRRNRLRGIARGTP